MNNNFNSYMGSSPTYDLQQAAYSYALDQYGNLTFDSNGTPSHMPPFFHFSQNMYGIEENAIKGPANQPLSHVRGPPPLPKEYSSRPVRVTPGPIPPNGAQQRRAKTALASQEPPAKRAKITATAQLPGEAEAACNANGCSSVVEDCDSQCCSSCSDGTPCAEPDCDGAVAVVPCSDQSCEQPGCPNPCLSTGLKNQSVASGSRSLEATTSQWIEHNWVPQMQRDAMSRYDNLIDPQLGMNEYLSAPMSPVSTPPSMANMQTPYSPNNGLPTPQLSSFQSHHNYQDQSSSVLTGAGAVFTPSVNQWQRNEFANIHDPNSIFNCTWNGCSEPFSSQEDWIPHLHQKHLDTQMAFDCFKDGEACMLPPGANPVDHLQDDHGYIFDENGNGYRCPAPTCPPEQLFLHPYQMHTHFDQAHATPAQGPLHCRLEDCNEYFEGPNELFTHINDYHHLPAYAHKDDEIELPSLSQIVDEHQPPSKISITKEDIEAATNPNTQTPAAKESAHTCKWFGGAYVCGLICDSEDSLQKHIKVAHLDHLDKGTGYQCQWEGCTRQSKRGEKAGFSQRGKLERHMATHTNFKCCKCDECGKSFSAEQSLKQHKLLHSGEKPWKCKHCGKGFPQQSACTIHERTHTNEKPLFCQICNKAFSESSNLSKHRKIHGEKGLNACDFPGCGKSFHRLDQLKRHQGVHERQLAKACADSSVVGSETSSAATKTECEGLESEE